LKDLKAVKDSKESVHGFLKLLLSEWRDMNGFYNDGCSLN